MESDNEAVQAVTSAFMQHPLLWLPDRQAPDAAPAPRHPHGWGGGGEAGGGPGSRGGLAAQPVPGRFYSPLLDDLRMWDQSRTIESVAAVAPELELRIVGRYYNSETMQVGGRVQHTAQG